MMTKPPPELALSGGYRQREKVGKMWRRLIVRGARLPRDGAILDVGCGLGRMAEPLTDYLKRNGRYEGIDVDVAAVQWCREHIGAAHPNFRFTALDVSSKRYNPDGAESPDNFVFPYKDSSFDVAILASVFTHLLPDAVARYLKELYRVLKPGGRCLATYFLLNERSNSAIEDSGVNELHRFPHRLAGCRILSKEVPESAVAHEEENIRRLYAEAGFSLEEPLGYGRWAGSPSRFNQDLVRAVKGVASPAGDGD